MAKSNKVHASSADRYITSEMTRISNNFMIIETPSNLQEPNNLILEENIQYEEEESVLINHFSPESRKIRKKSNNKLNIDFDPVVQCRFS